MTYFPIAFTFQIQLDDEETRALKLPGSRDIENFLEKSLNKAGVMISVHESEGTGLVYVNVEIEASEFPLYGEAKREVQRIETVLRKLVSEEWIQ